MNDSKDLQEKIIKGFENLEKSLASLQEVVELEKTDINGSATIQRFEYTFELFWKLLKKIIEFRSVKNDLAFTKDILREAYAGFLISDGDVWIEMLKDRNLTVHTYNEDLAQEIYHRICNEYFPLFKKDFERLKKINFTDGILCGSFRE